MHRIIGFTSLSLLLAIAAPVQAQERQSERPDRPEQQQNRHEQAKPAPQHGQQQAQHPQSQQRNSTPARAQQRPENRAPQQPQHAQQQPNRAPRPSSAINKRASSRPVGGVPHRNNRGSDRVHGNNTVPAVGNPITVLGNSAAAIVATAFPKVVTADTLAPTTVSASELFPSES